MMVASVTAQAADCDFSTGIQKLDDGRYAYSVDCHKKVGKMVADEKDRQEQLAQKDIQLKSLGTQLEYQDKRVQLWMDTSNKLEDRVNQMEALKSRNQWLFFGLGIVVTGAAVWGAGQLNRR
jgi:hypothetical protein